MENSVRNNIWVTIFFLAAATATAAPARADKFLSACDFISKSEVERLLGRSVRQPMVGSRGACLGWCESVNTSFCEFGLTSTSPEGEDQFSLEVNLPPFLEPERDLPRGVRQILAGSINVGRDFIENVPGFDGPAIYYYRADLGQSMIEVFSKRHIVFVVQQSGAFDQNKAFTAVVRAAHLVMSHYEAMPSRRLKGAFDAEFAPWAGETQPWKP